MGTDGDWRDQERNRTQVVQAAKALPREPTTRWVLAVVAALTLVWLGVLAWQVMTLPAQVPQHWSSGDIPDRWAPKAEAVITSAVMPLIFAYPMPLLSRLALSWPDALNVPNKQWWLATPRRLVRFERLLREDLWLMTAWMLVVFIAVEVIITVAAGRPGGAVSFAPMAILLAVLIVAMIGYIAWMYLRRYASDPAL